MNCVGQYTKLKVLTPLLLRLRNPADSHRPPEEREKPLIASIGLSDDIGRDDPTVMTTIFPQPSNGGTITDEAVTAVALHKIDPTDAYDKMTALDTTTSEELAEFDTRADCESHELIGIDGHHAPTSVTNPSPTETGRLFARYVVETLVTYRLILMAVRSANRRLTFGLLLTSRTVLLEQTLIAKIHSLPS